MKSINLAILAATVISAQPNPGRAILSGSATIGKVDMVFFESRIEPAEPAGTTSVLHGGVLVKDGIMYRYMADNSQHKYFGYEAAIGSVTGTNEFELVIRALSVGPSILGLEKPATWSALSLARYPAPQHVRNGDRLQFDLMVNPTTGQKLVEYIEVRAGAKLPEARPAVLARDFRLEDIELEVVDLQLFVNGRQNDAASGHGGMRGGPLWIYLANRGRYVFSLVPRPDLGFQRAGEIRGPEMNFKIDGDEFLLKSSSRIAPGGAAYHLYVYHDAAYKPKGSDAASQFILGAGGTLESLVRR